MITEEEYQAARLIVDTYKQEQKKIKRRVYHEENKVNVAVRKRLKYSLWSEEQKKAHRERSRNWANKNKELISVKQKTKRLSRTETTKMSDQDKRKQRYKRGSDQAKSYRIQRYYFDKENLTDTYLKSLIGTSAPIELLKIKKLQLEIKTLCKKMTKSQQQN